MDDDEALVEQHWPHLTALSRTLDAIDGRTIAVPAVAVGQAHMDDHALDMLIEKINQRAQRGTAPFVARAVQS